MIKVTILYKTGLKKIETVSKADFFRGYQASLALDKDIIKYTCETV